MSFYLKPEYAGNAYRASERTPENAYPRKSLQERGLRFYSPGLGRWLSRDPIGEPGGINLYVFADNSPVARRDAIGLATDQDEKDCEAAGGTLCAAGCCCDDDTEIDPSQERCLACCCVEEVHTTTWKTEFRFAGESYMRFGHDIDHSTTFSYVSPPSGQDEHCTILWEELTDKPYEDGMVAWQYNDMSKFPNRQAPFKDWKRDEAASLEKRSSDPVVFKDYGPNIAETPGNSRYLKFRVTVFSGCDACPKKKIRVYGVQNLKADDSTGKPEIHRSEFTGPVN